MTGPSDDLTGLLTRRPFVDIANTILGERENLSDGLSGSFTLSLDAGEYTLYCPGGDSAERGTLTDHSARDDDCRHAGSFWLF